MVKWKSCTSPSKLRNPMWDGVGFLRSFSIINRVLWGTKVRLESVMGVFALCVIFFQPTVVRSGETCPLATVTPGEVYVQYLGKYDLSELTEVVRDIRDTSGNRVGMLKFTYHERGTDFVMLVYDNSGNFIGYGAQTVRDSRLVSTTVLEIVESLTGANFGGNVSIDGLKHVECLRSRENSQPNQDREAGDQEGPIIDSPLTLQPLPGTGYSNPCLMVPCIPVDSFTDGPTGRVTVTDLGGGGSGSGHKEDGLSPELVPSIDEPFIRD